MLPTFRYFRDSGDCEADNSDMNAFLVITSKYYTLYLYLYNLCILYLEVMGFGCKQEKK